LRESNLPGNVNKDKTARTEHTRSAFVAVCTVLNFKQSACRFVTSLSAQVNIVPLRSILILSSFFTSRVSKCYFLSGTPNEILQEFRISGMLIWYSDLLSTGRSGDLIPGGVRFPTSTQTSTENHPRWVLFNSQS